MNKKKRNIPFEKMYKSYNQDFNRKKTQMVNKHKNMVNLKSNEGNAN